MLTLILAASMLANRYLQRYSKRYNEKIKTNKYKIYYSKMSFTIQETNKNRNFVEKFISKWRLTKKLCT